VRRRRLLKLGLWGGALLALGGAGLHLVPSLVRYRPRRPLEVLDEAGFNVLGHVAACVVDAPGCDPVEVAHLIDRVLSLGAPESAADFRKLLGLLESGLAGLLLDGRPRNFSRLGREAQQAALLCFRDSRLVARRSGYHALRKLCAAAYYSREASWAAIGYPGPPQIELPT
jgi:hypothetical protein